MTPLTPEQVAKLRLPEGWRIESIRADGGRWHWEARPVDPDPRIDHPQPGVVVVAELVATGDLPPEALDVVWAVVEGRFSYYSRDGLNNYDTHHNRDRAFVEAEAALDSAIDDESAEECGNVEWGMLIRLGGSRETGEVTTDAEGNKVVMFEKEEP